MSTTTTTIDPTVSPLKIWWTNTLSQSTTSYQVNAFLEETVLGGNICPNIKLHNDAYLESMNLIVEKYNSISFVFKVSEFGCDLLLTCVKLDNEVVRFGSEPPASVFYLTFTVNLITGIVQFAINQPKGSKEPKFVVPPVSFTLTNDGTMTPFQDSSSPKIISLEEMYGHPNQLPREEIMNSGDQHTDHAKNQNSGVVFRTFENTLMTDCPQWENYMFQNMKIQRRLEQDYESTDEFYQNITYLEVKFRENIYFVGYQRENSCGYDISSTTHASYKDSWLFKRDPSRILKQCYLSPEVIDDPCWVDGVGLATYSLYCLQIIKVPVSRIECNESPDMNLALLMTEGSGWTNQSATMGVATADSRANCPKSVLEANVFGKLFPRKWIKVEDHGRNNSEDLSTDKKYIGYHNDRYNKLYDDDDCDAVCLIGFYNMIGFESPIVFILFQVIIERITCRGDKDAVMSRFLPDILKLLDNVLVNRDFTAIQTVYRLQRYLNTCVMEPSRPHAFKEIDMDVALLIKMREIWLRITRAVEHCQAVLTQKPILNCYNVAYLAYYNKTYISAPLVIALITAFCQLGLIILLFLSLDTTSPKWFQFTEGIVIVPIIFLFTALIVRKQMKNSLRFYCICTQQPTTYAQMCVFGMDIAINLGGTLVVIFLNFFLLALATDLTDVVLNSVATLFIIELDDAAVFESDEGCLDLFRQYLIADYLRGIDEIDGRFWNSELDNRRYIDKNGLSTGALNARKFGVKKGKIIDNVLSVGIVGYSNPNYDQSEAKRCLKSEFDKLSEEGRKEGVQVKMILYYGVFNLITFLL